jgi:DNA gyrase/topoisomerase IV subunit B
MSKSSYVGSKVGVKKEKLAIIPLQGRILNPRDQNPSKIR